MTTLVVRGPTNISGEATVPGDKSISHRALLVAGAANGRSTLRGLSGGGDVLATRRCLHAYGVAIDGDGEVIVESAGIENWIAPFSPLDCANSGTTMRLLAGLAAHHEFVSTLDGDASLRGRPMDRIADPLRALGASVDLLDDRHPPVRVSGGALKATAISTGVASAQVKGCVIFAALGAQGRTVVEEPYPTRDHTERMLAALGAPLERESETRVALGSFRPPPFELDIAGDPSSVAYLVAAAVLAGDVATSGVCVNPTRTRFLDALGEMGASVSVTTEEERLGELVGRVGARRSELRPIEVGPASVPAMVDELPLLAVLATQAGGKTVVRGAEELRVKESDRITAVTEGLSRLGAQIEPLPDGFVVVGPSSLRGAEVDSAGDHRIAMALAIASLVAEGETTITGFDCVSVSWPGFAGALQALGADVEER